MPPKQEKGDTCEGFDFYKFMRIVGCIAGGATLGIGIYQLVAGASGPKGFINAIYQIIFGIFIIISELRWKKLLKHFKFLTHFLGLGMFYLFVGGLALGGAWYQIAVAILCLAVGVVYFILGVACRSMDKAGQQPGQQPDAIAEMKKQATQKAVEHVIENSNPFA